MLQVHVYKKKCSDLILFIPVCIKDSLVQLSVIIFEFSVIMLLVLQMCIKINVEVGLCMLTYHVCEFGLCLSVEY